MSGVAHATTEDDEYDGYFIPKGSLVIGSTWCVLASGASFALDIDRSSS